MITRRWDLKALSRLFGRFLGVGLAATVLQYAVLIAGVEWGKLQAAYASALGFALGAILNYLLNRRYTFRSKASHASSVARFLIVVALGLAANVLLMTLFNGYFGWNYVLSQVMTTGMVTLWNFVGHSLWTFRGR
ncbi:MAG: GtrA family protein [Burkholderiaceae bacterium]